jgi:hypothetical protein
LTHSRFCCFLKTGHYNPSPDLHHGQGYFFACKTKGAKCLQNNARSHLRRQSGTTLPPVGTQLSLFEKNGMVLYALKICFAQPTGSGANAPLSGKEYPEAILADLSRDAGTGRANTLRAAPDQMLC